MSKRLYMVTVDANDGQGTAVESYEISHDGPKGVSYYLLDGTRRHYAARNLYTIQMSNHGTRARCVFPCPVSLAAEEVRMRKLALIDALHTEGQRRAINLNRMEDAV